MTLLSSIRIAPVFLGLSGTVFLAIYGLFFAAAWGENTPGSTIPAPSPEIRAELLPRRHTTLSSELAARILAIAPRDGSYFRKGETLVSFDCELEMAQRQRARAILDAAEAQSKVHTRLTRFNATSKLEAQLALAETAKAQAELAIIQVKINRCQIKAPYSGRVAGIHAQEYQYVKAGDPLLDIHDEQNLEVVFLLDSRRLQGLRPSDRFRVHIGEMGRTYPVRITGFGATIDAVSQSVRVFGAIDGKFSELLPGMSGLVMLGTEAEQKQ